MDTNRFEWKIKRKKKRETKCGQLFVRWIWLHCARKCTHNVIRLIINWKKKVQENVLFFCHLVSTLLIVQWIKAIYFTYFLSFTLLSCPLLSPVALCVYFFFVFFALRARVFVWIRSGSACWVFFRCVERSALMYFILYECLVNTLFDSG